MELLVIYALLLAATLLAALIRQRRISAGQPADSSQLDRYDLAMLNGGPLLVAAVALLYLDRDGAVELGDRLLRELALEHDFDPEVAALDGDQLASLGIEVPVTLSGPLPTHAHPVEAAVYHAVEASHSRQPDEIVATAARDPAIDLVGSRLVQLGLMIDPAQRALLRRRWRWFLPLALLGLMELYFGPDQNRPLVLGLLAATAAAMMLVRRAVPKRTRAGSEVLEDLRADRPELAQTSQPLQRQHASMLMALVGPAALWAADPPLALAVGAQTDASDAWSDDPYPTKRGRTWGWTRWADGCGTGSAHDGCGGFGCGGFGGGGGCGGGGGGGCGGGGCGG